MQGATDLVAPIGTDQISINPDSSPIAMYPMQSTTSGAKESAVTDVGFPSAGEQFGENE
jgi:hypothetical protein